MYILSQTIVQLDCNRSCIRRNTQKVLRPFVKRFSTKPPKILRQCRASSVIDFRLQERTLQIAFQDVVNELPLYNEIGRRDSDWIRAGRSRVRSTVWERNFTSKPVKIGPGAHPGSCTMGTGSFLGVKRPECGVDHPPPSSAEVRTD
jgi:hypothetical protein